MSKLETVNRVMINAHEAVGAKRAMRDYNVIPDIIFVRDDGWSLGATKEFERDAFNMWPYSWTHFCLKPDPILIPISEYTSKWGNADFKKDKGAQR